MYDVVIDLEVDLGGDRTDPTPYRKENILSGIGWKKSTDTNVNIWENGQDIHPFGS